jgi:CheY-like chemotaxis protein
VKAVLAKSYTGVNDSVHLQDADIDPAWRSLRKLAMPEPCLEGRRILVAEDEYLIAFDVRDALVHAGAEVLGPVPSVDDAAALLERETDIDAAVLDVNLRGDMVFAVADMLQKRGIPLVFATGYAADSLPERFTGATRLEKPLEGREIADVLVPLLTRT